MPAPARAGLRALLASLHASDRAIRWADVATVGKIRSRKRGKHVRWYVDVRPFGQVYSIPGMGPIETKRDAERVLNHIQGELDRGKTPEQIMAVYLPPRSKPLLVSTRIERWLTVLREQVEAGDRSPGYLRELERYARDDGHFSWWYERSVHEIDTAAVDDWESWLRGRGIGPKTRRNVVGGFRAFLGWLRRREEIASLPSMPWVAVDEHSPTIVSWETQQAILQAIPDEKRGIFLALCHGLRPSEARALQVRDYADGWITVPRAHKGPRADHAVRGTKTRKIRRVPASEDLREWIKRHPPQGDRFRTDVLLFPNPLAMNRDRRWLPTSMRRTWVAACKVVGVQVGLYEGTKHAFATDAVRRGVQERHLQAFLGHSDSRTTRRYGRLADEGLVVVLRPSATTEPQGQEESK